MLAEHELSHPWFATPLGQRLLAEEQRLFDHLWTKVTGVEALQVGVWGHPGSLLKNSRLRNRLEVTLDFSQQPGMKVDPEALPFPTDSMDAVVLPHTLEATTDQHQVLREAARILSPQGHLLVGGFNPISMFAIPRIIGWRGYPYTGRFISIGRLRDWLKLLGFQVITATGCFYRPPFNHAGFLDSCRAMERLGPNWLPLPPGAFVILARKLEPGVTPLGKLVTEKRKPLGGMAEPAARRMH